MEELSAQLSGLEQHHVLLRLQLSHEESLQEDLQKIKGHGVPAIDSIVASFQTDTFRKINTSRIFLLLELIAKTQEEIRVVQLEIASFPTPVLDLPPQDETFRGIDISDDFEMSDSDSEDDAAAEAFAETIQAMMDSQEEGTVAASPSHHDGVRMLVDGV